MKKTTATILLCVPFLLNAQTSLRVNHAGYLCDDIKAAVYVGNTPVEQLEFELLSPQTGASVIDSVVACPAWEPFANTARIYFSSETRPGDYTLSVKLHEKDQVVDVAALHIGNDSYSRLNVKELPLNYLRQQRCGYNPAHRAKCHQHDGFVVLSEGLDGQHFDVTGGWHDASDYLQYLPTSANTVYQLLFAYRANPKAWADKYNARGLEGANGIPDILDEARWGIEWMMKMNPREGLYFNQIADDRDHRFVGAPQNDSTDYGRGKGLGRPVYPVSGKPYGLQKYTNRSTGEASSVGKFASVFALGAEVFADIEPNLATELTKRARAAYDYAAEHPGASQTAPCSSPYFYEEDNWADDMELAASAIHTLTGDGKMYEAALRYAHMEPVTPWMGADTARHYQWYPFVNLGHAQLATKSNEAKEYMHRGLKAVADRGSDNVFRFGVPFVWCSNNLAVGFVTQAMLYREITGDQTFRETETAVRDWLFGVNPWGQTMIIMPEKSVKSSPIDPHSALTDMMVQRRPGRDWLIGGLVDGPVYTSIFNSLWGVHLRNDDKFAHCQGPVAVYHDDFSDYSTNEPTMDGTASMAFMLMRLSTPE